ncbi:MAG: hypothetical protein IB617_00920 [Candidatus Nealsonbacteria bacterium]|nr:MAG: hypothetical protein IB617_00920 [Candidatus Nealsonbacteria bacterium]
MILSNLDDKEESLRQQNQQQQQQQNQQQLSDKELKKEGKRAIKEAIRLRKEIKKSGKKMKEWNKVISRITKKNQAVSDSGNINDQSRGVRRQVEDIVRENRQDSTDTSQSPQVQPSQAPLHQALHQAHQTQPGTTSRHRASLTRLLKRIGDDERLTEDEKNALITEFQDQLNNYQRD